MVVNSGLYVLALHVKEIVVHRFSQGTHSPWSLCRLEDHISNFHTLLRSFLQEMTFNLYVDQKLYN